MKDKATNEESKKGEENPISQFTEQAVKNFEEAMKTSFKWQQEAGKCWNQWMGQSTPAADWQKRFANLTSLVADSMPAAQKRTEEFLDLVEKNVRTGLGLVKQANDAAQTPGIAESQAKWADWWRTSLGAVRTNADTLAQIHSRAMVSWIESIEKAQDLCMPRTSKAA